MTCFFCDEPAAETPEVRQGTQRISISLPLCAGHIQDAVSSMPASCMVCQDEGMNMLTTKGTRDLKTIHLCNEHYEPVQEEFKDEI